MRVFSIIGCVFFTLVLLVGIGIGSELSSSLSDVESLGEIAALFDRDTGDALEEFSENVYGVWGFLLISGCVGLVFSIVVLVGTGKTKTSQLDKTQQLMRLGELRAKGVFTEDEFEAEKRKLML